MEASLQNRSTTLWATIYMRRILTMIGENNDHLK
jgi:hypothetical protein